MVRQAMQLITASGRQCFIEAHTAQAADLGAPGQLEVKDLAHQCDLLLVFGGDGTMLRVSRESAGSQTPLLGLNTGGLGFLTAVTSHRLPEALEHVWSGDFWLENRSLLLATGTGLEPTPPPNRLE